jgi:hypothetical protein
VSDRLPKSAQPCRPSAFYEAIRTRAPSLPADPEYLLNQVTETLAGMMVSECACGTCIACQIRAYDKARREMLQDIHADSVAYLRSRGIVLVDGRWTKADSSEVPRA